MTIEKRLEIMERELGRQKRRNRLLLGAMLLLAGGLIVAGAFKTTVTFAQAQITRTTKEIRTRNLFIEDESGRVRMGLTTAKSGSGKAGSGLALFDEDGKPRAILASTKEGSTLQLFDVNSKVRTEVALTEKGSTFSLWDENGKNRAELGLANDGPALALADESGNVRAALDVRNNRIRLALNNERGETNGGLMSGEDGTVMVLSDKAEKTHGMICIRNGLVAGFVDENNQFRGSLFLDKVNLNMYIVDKNGKITWSAIK